MILKSGTPVLIGQLAASVSVTGERGVVIGCAGDCERGVGSHGGQRVSRILPDQIRETAGPAVQPPQVLHVSCNHHLSHLKGDRDHR